MKKTAFLITLFFVTLSYAQAPLEKGKLQINAGFGTSGWGTPVYAGLDYGLGNNFTAGAEASYVSYKYLSYTSTIIGIQVNGNYHFNELLSIPTEWDLYGGLSGNYYIWSIDSGGSNIVDDTPFGIGAQIGARYFFNEQFGINIEGGGGNATSGGKIGVTYKF